MDPNVVAMLFLVFSQNKGTPIKTPKCYNPYYWHPQKGTPNLGKPLLTQHQQESLRDLNMPDPGLSTHARARCSHCL